MVDDLVRVNDALWVIQSAVHDAGYDFPFDRHFACSRPPPTSPVTALARVGGIADYPRYHQRWLEEGVRLLHDPEQHRRAAELPGWYPLLEGLTPRSLWFRDPPSIDAVAAQLGWPLFMKGTRTTAGQTHSLSLIRGPREFAAALRAYARNPLLHWQDIVLREFLPLRFVEDLGGDRIPSSFEFRTFWWNGELVGFGRYWWEGQRYAPTDAERAAAIALAAVAARQVAVPFLVVDVAQDTAGKWWVVECNDGQESGFGDVDPVALWRAILGRVAPSPDVIMASGRPAPPR